MNVNNDYEERLIYCVKQLRHNIQKVAQKDETYKRKPVKPIKHSIYEKKRRTYEAHSRTRLGQLT